MPPEPAALITEPTTLVVLLAGIVAVVFGLSRVPRLAKFFDRLPPVIWAYFLPMLATTLGVTPPSSAGYDWMTRYLLPTALFLMMLSVDLPAILRLGPKALLMMLIGSAGIVIGAPIAYGVFVGLYALFGGILPPQDPNAWQGFAALSGSWIGGSANLIAIQQSLGASDSTVAPLIVVFDTVPPPLAENRTPVLNSDSVSPSSTGVPALTFTPMVHLLTVLFAIENCVPGAEVVTLLTASVIAA